MPCLNFKCNTLYFKCPIKQYLGLLTVLSFLLSAAMVDLSADVCVCLVVFVAWNFEETKKRLNELKFAFVIFFFITLFGRNTKGCGVGTHTEINNQAMVFYNNSILGPGVVKRILFEQQPSFQVLKI